MSNIFITGALEPASAAIPEQRCGQAYEGNVDGIEFNLPKRRLPESVLFVDLFEMLGPLMQVAVMGDAGVQQNFEYLGGG